MLYSIPDNTFTSLIDHLLSPKVKMWTIEFCTKYLGANDDSFYFVISFFQEREIAAKKARLEEDYWPLYYITLLCKQYYYIVYSSLMSPWLQADILLSY